MEIKGHGRMHAVHIEVTANTMVVDDLGSVIGDLHNNQCVQGDGVTSTKGASGNTDPLFVLQIAHVEQDYNTFLHIFSAILFC